MRKSDFFSTVYYNFRIGCPVPFFIFLFLFYFFYCFCTLPFRGGRLQKNIEKTTKEKETTKKNVSPEVALCV